MQKISSFMFEALFAEGSGYYRTKNPIGKNADFITAPEISQVFGELIAAYLLQIFSTKKTKISLVEMGAGKGTLFFDILTSIKKLADKNNALALDFISLASLEIIEINEVLKKVQQEKLREFKINWHENFENLRAENELFFISNELFDCFAIDQFVKTDIGWCERLIDSGQFITAKFDLKTHQFVENILGFQASNQAPFGAIFEHSEAAQKFMKQLCEALNKRGGLAINFDYGHLKTEFANTLQALKNHQKTDILSNVGSCDITSHVDFGALEKISQNFGLNSSIILQKEFLLGLGIEERRKSLIAANPEKTNEINSAIDRLIAPDQMGELFKCHILWKNNHERNSRN